MKRRTGTLFIAGLALLLGAALGAWLVPSPMTHDGNRADSADTAVDSEDTILYWVAPMDPSYRRDGPGKSPMGMDLVPVYADDAEDEEAGGPALRIRPEVLNNIGARSAAVERRDLSAPFTAPGILRPDADRVAHIHVRTEGWVEQLHATTEGASVREGDLLFEIYSPALVSAQEEYLQAVKTDRTALVRASEERLRALGMLPAQIGTLRDTGRTQALYQQRAPQDGIVLELNIRQGMFVQPGTTIMSLADIRSVWLEAALFQNRLTQIAEGDPLTFSLMGSGDGPRAAQVDYIYPTITDDTRTGRVRAIVDNADLSLRPGQYVQVSFQGPSREDVLAIPNAAVIRSEGSTRVILDLGDGRFRPAEVRTGLISATHTEITHGIRQGTRVVTSAQFLIDSEASLEPALARMTGADVEPAEDHSKHPDPEGHDGHREQEPDAPESTPAETPGHAHHHPEEHDA